MKIYLVLFSLIYSSIVFSQSMLVMKTGKILSVDKQGIVNDLGQFILPYDVREIGGRYLIDEDRKVKTVDRNGVIYSKNDIDKVAAKIEVKGDNYFISKRGILYTIDENGLFFESKKEREYRNIKVKGGKFFVAIKKEDGEKKKVLYVVNHQGVLIEPKVNNLNINQINSAGGSYFTTSAGELFTVSSDGFIYSKKDLGLFISSEMQKGGNYFIYHSRIYTVTTNGLLTDIGSALQIGPIKSFGTNFLINSNLSLFTISETGTFQRAALNYNISDISLMSHL